MQPVKTSTGILLLPMSMSCFENISPVRSFAHILAKFSILTFYLKTEYFMHALSSSTGVDLGITGNI
jgi:hypothetical protein